MFFTRELKDAFDTALGLTLHKSALYLMQTKPSDAAFSNLDKSRLGVAGAVISGMALDYVGTDVHASLQIDFLHRQCCKIL